MLGSDWSRYGALEVNRKDSREAPHPSSKKIGPSSVLIFEGLPTEGYLTQDHFEVKKGGE